MNELEKVLGTWQMDVKAVRERMYGAPTARERERWHAMWLMARGMSATQVGEALERDAHTIGDWLETLREKGPTALAFEQSGGSPPVLTPAQQATLKAAVQAAPSAAGVELAKWTWKGVRQYIQKQFQVVLSSRTCLNYLHRLGFVLKRPKKRLTKANAEKREAFVGEYVVLRSQAQAGKAKIFFVDEAHFRADVELRSQWVLRGEPALVDSSSPRMGEKVTYYSAVCLETGEVEVMPIEGNSNAETSVAFLKQLREKYAGLLIVIWDNGPAHRGEAMRTYLKTPNLQLRLVALPPIARISIPMRPSGSGCVRKQRPTRVLARLPRSVKKWMPFSSA